MADIRRNMTPEEIRALWGQHVMGLQPTMGPVSLADLAMEPVSSLLDEADVSQYLLPAALLGLVRYKKPGVSAAARDAAEAYHRTPVSDPIRARDTVFHATGLEGANGILQSGEIVPRLDALAVSGTASWPEYLRLRPVEPDAPLTDDLRTKAVEIAREMPWIKPEKLDRKADESLIGYVTRVFGWNAAETALAKLGYRVPAADVPDQGVSVSRVPRVSSKEHRAISFVIPRENMPPSRPFTEPTFRKTSGFDWEVSDEYSKPRPMNPRFEFEDRTWGTEIPLQAVREMWLDRSALEGLTNQQSRTLADLVSNSARQGIPLREFSSGREMHSGRVKPKK